VWLVWTHATLPGVVALWWLLGAPGWPRTRPRRAAAA
jgi:hypothetical protein